MIEIKGWARTSLIDYPGHIATVFFVGGCNFRCPMCHNPELVEGSGELPSADPDEVDAFLKKRAGTVTGVVVTGGEPTLQRDLAPFLQYVRGLGYAVKLDSNGYRPDVLAALLDAELIDAVAMDVKAPPEKYGTLSGVPDLDIGRIEASLALLVAGRVPCELRTTVVPGWLDIEDIATIARWIADHAGSGARFTYVLQQFRGAKTLDPALAAATPYSGDVLRSMAARASDWLGPVQLRGV